MSRDGLTKGLLVPALLLTLSLVPIRPVQALVFNVNIAGFAFSPSTLTIREGDTVTWQNSDQVIYTIWTVSSKDQSTFDLSPPLLPGDAYSLAFPSCGSFEVRSFERLWITATIEVLIQGDINGDGVVNILDLVRIATVFGKSAGQPGFDPQADTNGDGIINILDLVSAATQFQKVCTP